MHFHHAQRRPRLVDHRVHGKVETHLIGKQTLDLQAGIVSEGMRRYRVLVRHNQLRRRNRRKSLVELLDYGDAAHPCRHNPVLHSSGEIGVSAATERARLAIHF